jgi:hypothetical protein
VDSAVGMAGCGVGPRSWTRAAGCQERASPSPTLACSRRGSCQTGRWSRWRSPAPRIWLPSGGYQPGERHRRRGSPASADRRHPNPVINATGVLMHTNPGRAAVGCRVTQRGLQQGCADGSSIWQTGAAAAAPPLGALTRALVEANILAASKPGELAPPRITWPTRHIDRSGVLATASQPATTGVQIDAAGVRAHQPPANGSLNNTKRGRHGADAAKRCIVMRHPLHRGTSAIAAIVRIASRDSVIGAS